MAKASSAAVALLLLAVAMDQPVSLSAARVEKPGALICMGKP
jgi:hypothetical protein